MSLLGGILKDGISGLIGSVADTADRFIQTKEEKAEFELKLLQIKNEHIGDLIHQANTVIEQQTKVITAEINGKDWLQRNWRPILMLSIVAIIVNNYILFPYINMFDGRAVVLELPDKLWNLMILGMSGYVAGRTGEKVVNTIYKNKK